MQCSFCSKTYINSRSLKNHQSRCPSNPDRVLQKCSDYTEEMRQRASEKSKQIYKNPEARKKTSEAMKLAVLNNPESYSSANVCGRTKIYEYNSIKFHGKWEVYVAQYLDRENIKWERPINPIPYEWNNSIHYYFPDFYLPDYDTFVEVKGYERDRDLAKWKVLPNLVVIKSNEITKIRKDTYNIRDLL